MDEAVGEFQARNFEESRSLFARAHALFPNARTHRGLGLAEFELRNYVKCIEHFEAALASELRPLDIELRQDTEELLVRANTFVGRYTISTIPALSHLTVDGYESMLSPDRVLMLRVGDHMLELHASDYLPEKRMVSVKGGEVETLSVTFKHAQAVAPRDDGTSRWYESPWLWVAAGVVVVGAGTSIALAAAQGGSKPAADGGTSMVVLAAP